MTRSPALRSSPSSNRILGRTGDAVMASTGEGIRIMPDVPDTHWAYLAMLEATTDHEYEKTEAGETWTSYDKETTTLAEGWHNIDGLLFHVNGAQQFDYNTTVDGLELDRNGRYTTGSEELDKLLANAVAGVVNDKMTQMEKLRAVYDYAKKTFGYLGIGTVDTSKDGWEIEQAINMLTEKRGNCYSWSSVFTYLAVRWALMLRRSSVRACPPRAASPCMHGPRSRSTAWPIPSIRRSKAYMPSAYGENYDLFMKKYGEAEWGYKKAEEPEQPVEPEAPEADASLVALMDKIYGDKKDIMVGQTVLYNGMGADGTTQPLTWFIGTDDVKFEAGLASEAMITSQAHSIVLLRMPEGTDMESDQGENRGER